MSLRPINVDFPEKWAQIKGTLESVISLSKVTRAEWNERFSDVYSVCTSSQDGLDEKLYKETKAFFEQHTKNLYCNIFMHSKKNLLNDYHDNWVKYKTGARFINLLYRFLNEHYTLRRRSDYVEHLQISYTDNEIMEIGQLALETWKTEVIMRLKELMTNALLHEVKLARQGERPSETVVHGVIGSLIDVQEYNTKSPLKLYQQEFEERLLVETSDFYRAEASHMLSTCNCSQYMQKVDTRLAEENLRVRKLFHPTSYDKVMKEAQIRLVQDHQAMFTSECRQMIKERKTADLSRMYKLLKPIQNGFSAMLLEFEGYIADTGLDRVKMLQNENEMGQFVNVLLLLHTEYTELVQTTFQSDQAFFGSRDRACTKIVNFRIDPKKPCRSPELLAKYCDSLLKKSTKNLPDNEIDEKLNDVITIFRYLGDKDVFQKFYSKLLAKRLIHGLSVSMDTEEGMITKLKLACGYEYTNKLHRMFTDIALSSDLDKKFATFLEKNGTSLGINFSLLVLQSGAWPLGQTAFSTVMLPQELCKSVQMFEAFYGHMFNGRKLTWLQHLSNGEIKLTYLKKPYIITCTTYQMAILLLFNENEKMSYHDISVQCQLDDKELRRTLQSVVDVKLLLKENATTTVPTTTAEEDDDDVDVVSTNNELSGCSFQLNKDFSNKRTKLKITAAVQKETPQELEQTHTSVDEDRHMYTQAAIVRIMKSRKVLKHNVLIQEVVDQSRAKFSPTTQLIKKCIEALIEKNYLERLPGTKDEYGYVA